MPFNKQKLPTPREYYYGQQLEKFKEKGDRATALCCFHTERTPSLSINLETGSAKCFSCGKWCGDVLSFHRERYYLGFKQAAQQLGAWE